MSRNFDFPPAGYTPPGYPYPNAEHPEHPEHPEGSRPSTIDPRHSSADLPHNTRALQILQRDTEERQRIFNAELRHYTTSHDSTPRQHLEDRAAANPNSPISVHRPRLGGSRPRRHMAAGRSFNPPPRAPPPLAPSHFSLDLPEPTLPRIGSPDMATAEYSGEAEVNRRRKRRKLEEDHLSPRTKVVRYGWKGQVVPGKLKMEIHECDGGLHSEAAAQDRQRYRQENLLINNKTVYCTDKSKCNIILRHAGEMSFSLRKLVIKAPESGFTAPIQEGMIFVSMSDKDLISRTSAYQLRSRALEDIDSEGEITSAPSPIPSEHRPVSRRRDSTSRTVPPPISDHLLHTYQQVIRSLPRPYSLMAENFPLPDDLGRSAAGADTPTMPSRATAPYNTPIEDQGFNVTTHCDEPSEDEEEESTLETLADRAQREQMPISFPPTSDEDTEDAIERARQARRLGLLPGPSRRGRRARKRGLPSRIEVMPDGEGTVGRDEILVPHARFFIEEEKSVVSVSFDPPVSGKFVLLKLWSPDESQNIDIQSIVAHGFAGPRMFPATECL